VLRRLHTTRCALSAAGAPDQCNLPVWPPAPSTGTPPLGTRSAGGRPPRTAGDFYGPPRFQLAAPALGIGRTSSRRRDTGQELPARSRPPAPVVQGAYRSARQARLDFHQTVLPRLLSPRSVHDDRGADPALSGRNSRLRRPNRRIQGTFRHRARGI